MYENSNYENTDAFESGLDSDILEDKKVKRIDEAREVKEVEKSVKSGGGRKKKKVDYEATVTLPSKGLLYKDSDIPADITLRGMTTKEEKILYASSGRDVFKKILKNCVISPSNLDVNKLVSVDETFLILQLRMVTYGDKYRVQARCPHCGETDTYNISLSDFDITYLDDDFVEPIEVELPRSGDTLGLRILRNEDTEFVDRYAKKFAKQFNLNFREVEYTCRMAKFIQTINGESVKFTEARDYVEDMPSLDSAKFWTVINKIDIGVDTRSEVLCHSCGEEFDFDMPINSEFFRPVIE